MPQVSVETIQFRSEGSAALPLLDRQQPVSVPEWVKSERRSNPVAYRIPNQDGTVEIIATFRSHDPELREARMQALRSGGPVGVGGIVPMTVTFGENGFSEPTTCRMELRGNAGAGVETVQWMWQVESGGLQREVDRTTHEIALILAEPCHPWSTDPARAGTTPWWEVLRLACAAAVGSRTIEEATSDVTRTVYHVWGGTHYRWGPSANYATSHATQPGLFDCERFLRLLDGAEEPEVLDCADTASIVKTFAAILGCPALEKALSTPGDAKPLVMVGHVAWRPPNSFGLHEVAVLRDNSQIWDACLQLNTSADVTRPASPELPQGMPPDTYLQLLLDGRFGMESLEKAPAPRSIGEIRAVVPARATDPLVALAVSVLNVERERRQQSDRRVTTIDLRLVRVARWELIEPAQQAAAPARQDREREPVARAVWRHLDQRTKMACDVFLCANARDARFRALEILGRLLPFGPRPLPDGPAEDLQFETSDGQAIVATFLNTVTHIRGASKRRVAPGEVADFLAAVREQLRSR